MGINLIPTALLGTNSSARSRITAAVSGASWIVRKITFVEGAIRRISYAAWIPFITGILISRRTMSGFSFRTFRRASSPSIASPQTQTWWSLSSVQIVRRAVGWSSTTKMPAIWVDFRGPDAASSECVLIRSSMDLPSLSYSYSYRPVFTIQGPP